MDLKFIELQTMKVWHLIIISSFSTNLIKNANSVDEPGHEPKLYKSFDEIYGKGWDAEVPEFTETKEWHKKETQTKEVENKSTDQPNPNEQSFSDHFESFANRKIRERFDEMFDENWSEDDNEFIEEAEADSTNQNDCIDGQKCQKVQENNTKLIKRRKNVYSVQQKREIVEEFIKMKYEFKQKGKYSQKESDQNNSQIAKSFGVGYRTILKWKKECGLSVKKIHSNQERTEKLKQYCEIKRNNPTIKEFEIAEILKIDRRTLNKWKMELKNNCSLTEFDQIIIGNCRKLQRVEILNQYCAIKKTNPKIKDLEIAKNLNIGKSTLKNWKREFKNAVKNVNDCSLQKDLDQIAQQKVHSDQQKHEIVQKYLTIIERFKQNGKHSSEEWGKIMAKIAKKLGVGLTTLLKWKKESGLSIKLHLKQEKMESSSNIVKLKE